MAGSHGGSADSSAALYRVGDWLIDNRGWVSLVTIAFTAFMAYEASKLEMFTSFNELLPYRHPFIAVYLALPRLLRSPLQRLVKVSPADAHPLVGACNDPVTVRRMLEDAGFVDNRLRTVDHLRQAWGRRPFTAMLGRVGDALVGGRADRRSSRS
jgi:predicted RND superfamily exporter protein